jgi:hypothetical protein
MEFKDLERRIQPPAGLRREEWDRHANGGGWVQKSALVYSSELGDLPAGEFFFAD